MTVTKIKYRDAAGYEAEVSVGDKIRLLNTGVEEVTYINVASGFFELTNKTDIIKRVFTPYIEVIYNDPDWKKNSIFIEWNINDVHHTAEEMELRLTDDAAREVLEHLYRKHDSDLGICWETIRATIEHFFVK